MLAAVKGCMLAAFICGVFDVCFMENAPEKKERQSLMS